ncbi:MAG: hypothetical protein LAT50_15485, partial [Ectothiorhodospiraceae bacterium]|nr:hypothetical protein [Ectothiorhodospiraceae bacterium]
MHPRLPGSAVTRLLAELKPKTVPIIGRLPELELADIAGEPAVTELTAAEHKHIARLGLQDLVALGHTLETLPRRDGLALLAGLRDLYARRILVRLLLDRSGWTQADM